VVTAAGIGGEGDGSAGAGGGKGESCVPGSVGLAVPSVDGAELGDTGLASIALDAVVLDCDAVGAAVPEAIEPGTVGTTLAVLGGVAVAAVAFGATGAGASMLGVEPGAAELDAAMLGIVGPGVLGLVSALGPVGALGTGVVGPDALDAAVPRVGSGPGVAAPGVAGLAVVDSAAVWLAAGGSTTSRDIFSRQSTRSRIGSCAHARILSFAASVTLCPNVTLDGATATARQIQTGFMAAPVLEGTGLLTCSGVAEGRGVCTSVSAGSTLKRCSTNVRIMRTSFHVHGESPDRGWTYQS